MANFVQLFSIGIQAFSDPTVLLATFIGCVAGIIVGMIPGFTITMGVILVLPFTFGMSPLQGISTMVGVAVGGASGGLISATLIGIPGTPSSVATTFDGFPMARNGEPGRAIGLGTWASFRSSTPSTVGIRGRASRRLTASSFTATGRTSPR